MYKILFIDEEQDDIDSFFDYIEEKDVDGEFEIKSVLPSKSLEEMVEEIISYHPDAIVTDFMLNEIKTLIDYNIPYNGVELVEEILMQREGFPCFVITSFDDEAISKSDDVNLVYIKGILHGTEIESKAKASFLDRVKNQIIHYQTNLVTAENRIIELLQKKEETALNANEEEELIHLDGLIEKALDKRYNIASHIKTESESESLTQLLNKVDELTQNLKNKG